MLLLVRKVSTCTLAANGSGSTTTTTTTSSSTTMILCAACIWEGPGTAIEGKCYIVGCLHDTQSILFLTFFCFECVQKASWFDRRWVPESCRVRVGIVVSRISPVYFYHILMPLLSLLSCYLVVVLLVLFEASFCCHCECFACCCLLWIAGV